MLLSFRASRDAEEWARRLSDGRGEARRQLIIELLSKRYGVGLDAGLSSEQQPQKW